MGSGREGRWGGTGGREGSGGVGRARRSSALLDMQQYVHGGTGNGTDGPVLQEVTL